MLLALALGWATLQCGRFLLPPLLPRITETLSFSPAGIGAALTAFGLVYAVVQYPSGTYSDELSRATLIVPGFGVLVVGFVAIALSVTAALFVGAVVVLGIGKGLFASPSRALLGDLFTARRGRALGIYSAGTDVGGVLASGLAVAVLATTVWQVAFLPVIVVLTLVGVLYVLWNREPYERARVELSPGETAGRLVATRDQRETLVAFSIFYFFVGGLTNFFPTLLVSGGFSETVASGSFALLFGAGILAKPVAGDLSDRFPRLLVGVCGLLVSLVGTALVLVAPSLPVIAVGTVLTALGYKSGFPIADTVVMEAAPDGSMGSDVGASRAVFLTANALGPGFVGIVAQQAGFTTAFWALAGSLLISVALLARQYRRHRRERAPAAQPR
ncbi:MFS transporter [Halovenus sp. WSH3]|uniref:MFS transporter n=1 Tax=Halovenus carboxidivorans TaxID=2692199 RepID=A0A6B0SXI1_9EURY|nr:MFS transporter [Halovenus carboxidivorans]